MKKRGLSVPTILITALFLFVLVASSSFTSANGDVAYIYRKEFNIDQNVIGVFSEMGLTTDVINEDNMSNDLSSYNLIFVGDELFRKEIPVNKYPSVVAGYHHGDDWGLADRDGISQLGSTSPLTIEENSAVKQVYLNAFKRRRIAVPYYFLDNENKADALVRVAATMSTSSGNKFGDVIAYAPAGVVLENSKVAQGDICFFGLIESAFWTPEAREMFKDCVRFVMTGLLPGGEAVCNSDTDCPLDTESNLYCAPGTEDEDDNVYKNVIDYHCENPGTARARCFAEESVVLVEDCGFGCLAGMCLQVHCFNDTECTDGNESTEDVCHNPGVPSSFCTNEPIICFTNADCGADRFVGDQFCSNNTTMRLYETFTCNNPGSADSFCSSISDEVLIEMCSDVCVDGMCQEIECTTDAECDDLNPATRDECVNPGAVDSFCSNEPIEITCSLNSDCGIDGFIDEPFCSGDSVVQLFETFTCNNPGTENSSCSSAVTEELTDFCAYGCVDGICLPPGGEGIHDVSLVNFTNAINNIRIEDSDNVDILGNELLCNEEYKIGITIENKGDFIENVSFTGSIDSLQFAHNPQENLAVGDRRLKTKIVNITFAEGSYTLMVEAMLLGITDENPAENMAQREVFVVCSVY